MRTINTSRFVVAALALLLVGLSGTAESRPVSSDARCEAPSAASSPLCQARARAADDRATKSAHYALAMKHGSKDDYRGAARELDKLVAQFPMSPVALYTRALAYHNLGQDDVAIRDASKALRIDPASANSYFVRGAALQSKGAFEDAIRDYGQAVMLAPDHEAAYLALATAYFSIAAYDRAIASIDKALELNDSDAALYLLRGICHRELDNIDRAIADLRNAIRLDPDNEQATALLETLQPGA